MPSPIGHALGGLIVALATHQPPKRLGPDVAALVPHRTWLLTCAVAGCLADVDFLWGRHNMETHSVGFAVLVGLAVYVARRSTGLAVACALSAGTHVLFDWLGSDDFPPLGVMGLWPFSDRFFFADAFVFEAISRRYWLPGFVQHNLLAVAREIVILLPITVWLRWWRSRRSS